MTTERLTIFSVIVAVAALVLVFELLRRRRLREKYAVIWVIISVGTLVIAVFPQMLRSVAGLVGILFAVSLQLSREVGLLEEQSRRLAEEVGALHLRVDALEQAKAQEPELAQRPQVTVPDAE